METLSLSLLGRQGNIVDKWYKTHSYLCGLGQLFGFVRRSSNSPRLVCIGSELTGVHRVLGREPPGLGGYHIGGVGVSHDEALIKSIGELHERYAQLIAPKVVKVPYIFESLDQLETQNIPPLSLADINCFDNNQYNTPNFPFKKYSPDQKLGWYQLSNMLDDKLSLWIPGQMLFIGYNPKFSPKEIRINTAVTTGTATHSNKSLAILNSLLELIQLDVAIGTWYSEKSAKRVILDSRTGSLEKILKKYARQFSEHIQFYIFESPENWSSFNVACVYRRASGAPLPKVAVGLGSDLSLERALYKAFLECYGVLVMLRYELLFYKPEKLDKNQCYDIDSNVCYHGLGSEMDYISSKFPESSVIRADQIAGDINLSPEDQVCFLSNQFVNANKRLYLCDLTTPEAEAVGFYNYRVWSPDLLPLCFPSAPWKNHKRFKDYGGATRDIIHPYP